MTANFTSEQVLAALKDLNLGFVYKARDILTEYAALLSERTAVAKVSCALCFGRGESTSDGSNGRRVRCKICGGTGAQAAQPGANADARMYRQVTVHDWCVAAFGDDHAKSIEQRGIRLVEEAVEAGQACGCDPVMVHRLVDHIYDKPVGELMQELGGVGVTMLALAEAAGIDADKAERMEIDRVLSKPLKHFAARNAAKNAAGFNVLHAAAPTPPTEGSEP